MNSDKIRRPRWRSFINGTIAPLPIPGVSGFDRQVGMEIEDGLPGSCIRYFTVGYLAVAYPMAVGLGMGIFRIMS